MKRAFLNTNALPIHFFLSCISKAWVEWTGLVAVMASW